MSGQRQAEGSERTWTSRGKPRREEDVRLAHRDRELEAARRISEALFQHLTPDAVAIRAVEIALETVNAESGSILLSDPATEQLIFRHSIGSSRVKEGTAIPWGKGIAGEVFRSGIPIVIRDAHADPRHYGDIDKMLGHVTRDMIALPIKRWEGDPIGVFEVLNKREGRLDDDDLAILTIVSAITAASLEQARLFQDAKLAEVARIVGDIGHDIKNLLMPMVCGAGLLESEIKEFLTDKADLSTAKAKDTFRVCAEVVRLVKGSSKRIQDHVAEIADCVKGLSSRPVFGPCRISDVVRSVYDTLRWHASDHQVNLSSEGLDNLPTLIADERRLFSAFYNLVNNAIPEMPTGGTVTIRGRADLSVGLIVLEVADTGGGMPEEVKKSLFTARVVSRKPGGTGLGTKIVKDVVDVHHGRIAVDSSVGKGTTFHIQLPIAQP
jgi:signal transduction histidine kinase